MSTDVGGPTTGGVAGRPATPAPNTPRPSPEATTETSAAQTSEYLFTWPEFKLTIAHYRGKNYVSVSDLMQMLTSVKTNDKTVALTLNFVREQIEGATHG